MPDWLLAAIIAAVPGVLGAGGLWVRVQRVEKDVEQCVRRELFDVQIRGVDEKLSRIDHSLNRLLDRVFENTSPGKRFP